MAYRPDRVVAVAGTATEVGKTWAAAALVGALRAAGGKVSARKPVQSFEPGRGPTDAEVLAAATGERPEEVCPRHRWYPLAQAPPMAAAQLDRPPFSVADLLGELVWPDGVDYGVVETVGGPHSPLAADGDSAALIDALAPDAVVLVADAGLGAINAVRLALAALPGPVPVVLLNRYDTGQPVHPANAAWLRRSGVDVVTSVGQLLSRLLAPARGRGSGPTTPPG